MAKMRLLFLLVILSFTKLNAQKPLSDLRVVSVQLKSLNVDSTKIQVYAQVVFDGVLPGENLMSSVKAQYKVGWSLYNDYGQKEKLAFENISTEKLSPKDLGLDGFTLEFTIPQLPRSTGVLMFEMVNKATAKKYLSDLAISFGSNKFDKSFALKKEKEESLSFKQYINLGERFSIIGPYAQPSKLFMIQYTTQYGPAVSPLTPNQKENMGGRAISLIRQIDSNTPISIAEEGLYFVVKDTANLEDGLAFLGVDDRFPRLTYPAAIAGPLKYISTSKESDTYFKGEVEKLQIDQFLLSVFKGKAEFASGFMQQYYRNVTEANTVFTNYKEGWKTDRGMVLIVLGHPHKVQRSRDRETWSYLQADGYTEMIFTFLRKPNVFSENNFELIRYPEYQDFWFDKIDTWRKAKGQ